MSRLVEEILETWRFGERLLEDLPPIDPDHETVRLAVEQLRAIYQELTHLRDSSQDALAASELARARTRVLLDEVSMRLGPGGAPDAQVLPSEAVT
jgi:hypothetical protein